jgi:RNA polymerase sigma-70 factor, ECF subfamily
VSGTVVVSLSCCVARGLALTSPIQSPSNPRPSDRIVELLRHVAGGDRTAFASLYTATSAKLYGIILRILIRRDLSDEILQDVYLKVWQMAGDYDAAKGSPITWMAAIARNRAIDEVRRVRPVSIEDNPEAFDYASHEPDAFATLQSKQEMQRLLTCIEGLGAERRDMVMLAYFHGASREALAEKFSKPVATVKTWLHRSIAQLKDCVGS